MKKSSLRKDLFREIWKTKNRFISILAIVAVGVGFFAGVKASGPDMKLSMAQYVEQVQLMDIQLLSTYGFNENDIAAVQQDPDVRKLEKGYSADLFLDIEGQTDTIAHVLSLPDTQPADGNLNQVTLIEGRMPQAANECVIEEATFNHFPELKIGTDVRLQAEEGEEISDLLDQDTYTIVGIVQSPLYISFDRGKTKLGDGTIDLFLMIPEQAFALDVYTNLYLTLNSTQGLFPFDTAYQDAVSVAEKRFEAIADVREPARLEEIKAEAQADIDEAQQELADGEATQKKELADAQKKIDDAQQELDDGRKELEDAKAEFEDETASARKKIKDAKKKLNDGEAEYKSGLADYEAGAAAFPQQKQEALDKLAGVEQQKKELEQQVDDAQAQLDGIRGAMEAFNGVWRGYRSTFIPDPAAISPETQQAIAAAGMLSALADGVDIAGMLTQYVLTDPQDPSKEPQYEALSALRNGIIEGMNQIKQQIEQGRGGIAQMQQGIDQGYAELAAGEQALADAQSQLTSARSELDTGWSELKKNERKLEDGIDTAEKEFADAEKEIKDGEQKLADARKDYQEGKDDSDQEIRDAKKKLADAQEELDDLKLPEWYVQDRDDNPGYANYAGDADKVDAISAVFPVFFILVAALVCLTTMTRMVEEQRMQVGTLKALGYSGQAIAAKFLIYATLASVIGSIVGLIVGFQLFPGVVITAYETRYVIPVILTPFHWDYAFWCVLASVLCTGLAAFAAVRVEIAEQAAQLMRPKSPKAGKRVLLERIPAIWNKLNFTQKVTVRNLLRYKKRFAMTVIGIAGCTALMLTGFGINYAVTAIVAKQYPDIFAYSAYGALQSDLTPEQAQSVKEHTLGIDGVSSAMLVSQEGMEMKLPAGQTISVNLFVPQMPSETESYIRLHERVSRNPLTLDNNGAIINEKLAKLFKLKVGDTITMEDLDGDPLSMPITGITENYTMHYAYVTPEYYESLTGEVPTYNVMLANFAEGADGDQIVSQMLKNDDIMGVQLMTNARNDFEESVESLITVVLVLIVSAGILAIIVLYNLTNINITERIREIATIKVLGFHDKEVSGYIFRENIISSLIGIGVGLIGGIFLEQFVASTAEIEEVMFAQGIPPSGFILAALFTLGFTLSVNLVMHFKLKKVDMVESLKSME